MINIYTLAHILLQLINIQRKHSLLQYVRGVGSLLRKFSVEPILSTPLTDGDFDSWSDDINQNPIQSIIFSQEPKWFRRRSLNFSPSGVIQSTFIKDDDNLDTTTNKTVTDSSLYMPKNIRRLALFPFDDGQAFPTGTFPLNIFVMKFRMMMNDICSNINTSEKMFGIVCSDGKDGLCSIGTGVEILDRKLMDDGRQIISTVCRSRFKIINIVQEEPYLIADVDYDVQDLDIFMIRQGLQVQSNIKNQTQSGGISSNDEAAAEATVTRDLPQYLSNLEKEVYQALKDVLQLAASVTLDATAAAAAGGQNWEQSEPAADIELQIPKTIRDLSPTNHPYLRLNIASDFSFAVSDMIGGTSKLRQLLLESETLDLRLYRLRNLLVSSRNFLYSQLQEAEPFG